MDLDGSSVFDLPVQISDFKHEVCARVYMCVKGCRCVSGSQTLFLVFHEKELVIFCGIFSLRLFLTDPIGDVNGNLWILSRDSGCCCPVDISHMWVFVPHNSIHSLTGTHMLHLHAKAVMKRLAKATILSQMTYCGSVCCRELLLLFFHYVL